LEFGELFGDFATGRAVLNSSTPPPIGVVSDDKTTDPQAVALSL